MTARRRLQMRSIIRARHRTFALVRFAAKSWRKAGREVEEVEKTVPPPNSKQHVGLSDGQSRSQQLKAA
jgi:hypothetical protein